MIDYNSKIKDVYEHPIGKDIINKILLQMNVSSKIITNPVIGNLSLKKISKINPDFIETFISLLNNEKDMPALDTNVIQAKWWKEGTFYQIYPRSFCDSNDDGMGDIPGILSKLDYLKELGIDAVWLSPVYDSPQDDNGYDIRDYRKIWAPFGTMEDFNRLLEEVHKRDIKLIMDLVINHTSDEHEWFQQALKDKDSKYHDYYFFQEKPNNWVSFFSGSAWNYYEELNEYGLHLFSKKQMDLNWDNENVRKDIIDMIRWWLEKGVDGFRMDVINYISKDKGLPDGNEMVGQMMEFTGIEHYFYGSKLHDYLKEIQAKAFAPYHAFSVGEMPGVGMEMGKLLTGDDRKELDMFFSFDHLETPGHVRFDDYIYDLNYLKSFYINWEENLGNHCWMALFLENHDNPRMISKVEKDSSYYEALSKLLLTIQCTLKGTPFIYQGQELGLSNVSFQSIEEMHDVESINKYQALLENHSKEEAFQIVLSGSRDHARQMIDWENSIDNSVYEYTKRLISLRKQYSAFIYGDIKFVNKETKNLFSYYRKGNRHVFYIEANLSNKPLKRKRVEGTILLSNGSRQDACLDPYQINIIQIR